MAAQYLMPFPRLPSPRAFACLAILASGSVRVLAADGAPAPAAFSQTVTPLLQKYCFECHGNGQSKGDVVLDRDKTLDDIHKAAKKWESVMLRVRSHEMPPDDAENQPSPAEREVIGAWVEKELFQFDPSKPDPGRVTLHRLNRNEYNNTVRDLVGVNFQPADDFPADNSGYGFDNISDVLSVPPVLLEKYLAAARRVLDEAIPTEAPRNQVRKLRANLMEMGFNADGDRGDGWMPLGALEEDGVSSTITVPPGDYIVRAHMWASPRGKYGSSNKPLSEAPIVATMMLNETVLGEWKVAAPEDKPETFEMRIGVPAGKQRFAIVNRRVRGGANELVMRNGRIGPVQGGTIWVKSVEIEGPLPTRTQRVAAKQLEIAGEGRFTADGTRVMEREGEAGFTLTVPREGDYVLRAQAFADQAGPDPARMEFRLDGKPLKTFDVLAPAKLVPIQGQRVFSIVLLDPAPQVYEFPIRLPAGRHRFSAAFVNDFTDAENKNPNLRNRNLYLQHLEVAGVTEPAAVPGRLAPMEQLFAKAAQPPAKTGMAALFARFSNEKPTPPSPAVQARTILAEFARRAWRRPVQPAEVDELMKLYDFAAADGESFQASVKLALQAVLVSPYFLFRGDVPAATPAKVAGAAPTARPIGEFALASRLSYFLWSSMPDDELLDLADRGALRKNLDAQMRRMLASPKAQAFVSNFAGQWLEIRNLKFVAPDKEQFPNFDEPLREAMRSETEAFFAHILQQDRSILEFLNADYSFVNERLARHYGLANVTGDELRQVSLAGTPRRGILTHASVLTITSNPTRTSPVKRGKWVLEGLLGTPPPPPPPDVPELENDGKPVGGTLRHQLEEHRKNPTCASCHARMDPIGFGLENFDGIGMYRSKDGEFAVDASGTLVSGESFTSATGLADILAGQKRDFFVRCLAEKLLTYALGRGMERYDRPALDAIVKATADGGYKFSAMIGAVLKSVPFDLTRVEPAALAAR